MSAVLFILDIESTPPTKIFQFAITNSYYTYSTKPLYKYAFTDNKLKSSKKRYACSLFEKCQISCRELALLDLRSGISLKTGKNIPC